MIKSDHFIACTTKMLELDSCKAVPFSSAQPRANKPSVRRHTSSRRFDYLVVKEQFDGPTKSRTDGRLAERGQSKKNLYKRATVNLGRRGSSTAADYRRG